MLVDFNLSLSDLVLDKTFAKAYGENNETTIKSTLYKYGMDVSLPYEEKYCTHRNLQKEIVSCVRFEGYERTDEAYIKSGMASTDAVIASSKDPHMRDLLKSMSREGFSGEQHERMNKAAVKAGK